MTTATLPALIQQFFTDRLCTQMAASPNTIAGYRRRGSWNRDRTDPHAADR